MCLHIAFNRGFETRHGFTTGHQISDLLACLFPLAEVSCNCTTNEHCEVIAHCHGMHHLMGDENDRQATTLGFIDDTQYVSSLLDAEGCRRLIKDENTGSEIDSTGNRERLAFPSGKATDQTITVGDACDPHFLNLCNCHSGWYDLTGKNVAGPPPRPLDAYVVNLRRRPGGPEHDIVVSRA